MTTPRTTIDRGVTALFRAIAANAKGDRLMVAAARGELVALAGAAQVRRTQKGDSMSVPPHSVANIAKAS